MISLETMPVNSNARPIASIGAETHPLEPEPEPVDVLDRPSRDRTECHLLTVSDDRENERSAFRARDDLGDVGRGDGLLVDRDQAVAGPKPDLRGGRVGDDLGHRPGRLAAAGHEEEGEEHDCEQDVRRRPCGDGDETLPGRGLPVGVRPQTVPELGEPLLGGCHGTGRELTRAELALEVVERPERGLEIVIDEGSLDAIDRARQRGVLPDCMLEAALGVVWNRAMHSGDRDEAAERDRSDAVLDSPPLRLHERRRKAHVELPRSQAYGE